MATMDEENCPACLADRGWTVIMDIEHTTTGLLYHCPECDMSFTADELLRIYFWAKERYHGN
jgi:hypothetical protein